MPDRYARAVFERGIAALLGNCRCTTLFPCSSIESELEGKVDAEEESVDEDEREGVVGGGVDAPDERDMSDGERCRTESSVCTIDVLLCLVFLLLYLSCVLR